MRGNENGRVLRPLTLLNLFPIPMRGNEGKQVPHGPELGPRFRSP